MSELVQFIKTQFQQSGNGLMKVVLLNIFSFLALLLLKIVLVVGGYEAAYIVICQRIALPASWSIYLNQPWALLTHCWVHVSFFPTFWGLLLLHTIGKVVIHRLGSRHFIALYLLGGLVGGISFLLLYNVSPHFQGTTASLLGFSGSLYAVIVAAVMLSPQHSLLLFLWGPLKLKYIVGFLVLIAVANLVGADPAASIAHLGGALLGYVYVKQLKGYGWLRQYWAGLRRPSKYRKMTCHRVAAPSVREDDGVQADQVTIDRILDKVATSGYESLTLPEKQQLFNAGK